MHVFESIGEQSRRELVANIIADADYGETVTYEQLGGVLDRADRSTIRAAVNSAKRGLETDHRKAVEAVAGIGYRIVNPAEQIDLATRHQKKSRRSIVRALSKVTNVDAARLTEQERAVATLAATSLALQIDYMRRNDLRVGRLERVVEAAQGRHTETNERTEAELAELRERLARLETRPNAS